MDDAAVESGPTVAARLPKDFSMLTQCKGEDTHICLGFTLTSCDEARALMTVMTEVILPLLELRKGRT